MRLRISGLAFLLLAACGERPAPSHPAAPPQAATAGGAVEDEAPIERRPGGDAVPPARIAARAGQKLTGQSGGAVVSASDRHMRLHVENGHFIIDDLVRGPTTGPFQAQTRRLTIDPNSGVVIRDEPKAPKESGHSTLHLTSRDGARTISAEDRLSAVFAKLLASGEKLYAVQAGYDEKLYFFDTETLEMSLPRMSAAIYRLLPDGKTIRFADLSRAAPDSPLTLTVVDLDLDSGATSRRLTAELKNARRDAPDTDCKSYAETSSKNVIIGPRYVLYTDSCNVTYTADMRLLTGAAVVMEDGQNHLIDRSPLNIAALNDGFLFQIREKRGARVGAAMFDPRAPAFAAVFEPKGTVSKATLGNTYAELHTGKCRDRYSVNASEFVDWPVTLSIYKLVPQAEAPPAAAALATELVIDAASARVVRQDGALIFASPEAETAREEDFIAADRRPSLWRGRGFEEQAAIRLVQSAALRPPYACYRGAVALFAAPGPATGASPVAELRLAEFSASIGYENHEIRDLRTGDIFSIHDGDEMRRDVLPVFDEAEGGWVNISPDEARPLWLAPDETTIIERTSIPALSLDNLQVSPGSAHNLRAAPDPDADILTVMIFDDQTQGRIHALERAGDWLRVRFLSGDFPSEQCEWDGEGEDRIDVNVEGWMRWRSDDGRNLVRLIDRQGPHTPEYGTRPCR